MAFYQKLDGIIQKQNSLVCVGLDSDIAKIPVHLQSDKTPQFTFNKAIIDATHDLACAYKPNSAFYEARGVEGIIELKMTCDYIRQNFPESSMKHGLWVECYACRASIGMFEPGMASGLAVNNKPFFFQGPN